MGGALADIADYILNSEEVTVCRVKDRFTEPSDAGWTDLMLNFYLNDDDDQHVCEVQLIHFKMLSQRTTQEGHGAYNVFRAASELLKHRNVTEGSNSEFRKIFSGRKPSFGQENPQSLTTRLGHCDLSDNR